MAQVLSAVLHHDPPPPDVPLSLQRIVQRCLAKQPSQRFQTMSDVRNALEQLSTRPVDLQASIAVLPFSTMSSDKEDEYFSDGLSEEIINTLAQIPGLNVTARTSSFAFRGKEQDIRKIAETLNVRTILEGSVRRAGSRIRVTAQLINAVNGYHLWSERYDRQLADVFAIQDEIAQAIAVALKVKLYPEPVERRRHTPSVPAYESFLKARYFIRKARPQSLALGKECLDRAVALDPDFALAHSELAMYFSHLASLHLMPASEALVDARAAAQRALELDPSLAEAHAAVAVLAAFLDYNWEGAGRHFQQAIAHDPVPASVSHYYGFFYLLPLGRISEAINELQRALIEDPLNVQCRTQLAVLYWTVDRTEEAARQFRQALELDENFWLALLVEGLWHAQERRIDDAAALAEKAYSVAPKNTGSIALLAAAVRLQGDKHRSEHLLSELGDGEVYGAPLGFLIYYTALLEIDQAADWAEKAIEQRDPNIIPATCGPNRKLFESAGRWPALARKMNLPETITGQRA
jgi:serine/threonine-protein kinase